jgi:hypothetical protein
VYSFGVVLLQLVAGRPATQRDPEPTSIVQWARPLLAQGNIEAVADRRMRGDHDINGVWKVADVALSCTAQQPAQRPSMTEVAATRAAASTPPAAGTTRTPVTPCPPLVTPVS